MAVPSTQQLVPFMVPHGHGEPGTISLACKFLPENDAFHVCLCGCDWTCSGYIQLDELMNISGSSPSHMPAIHRIKHHQSGVECSGVPSGVPAEGGRWETRLELKPPATREIQLFWPNIKENIQEPDVNMQHMAVFLAIFWPPTVVMTGEYMRI